MAVQEAQGCQVDILQPVPSSRSPQLPSLRGCQTSTTAKWIPTTLHVAVVTPPWNDRAPPRRASSPAQAPLTTCSTAVATSSTVDHTTGRRQLRPPWSDQDVVTRCLAICTTSPGNDELVAAPTQTGSKTGLTTCCHCLHNRPHNQSARTYTANHRPPAHSVTSSTRNSHGQLHIPTQVHRVAKKLLHIFSFLLLTFSGKFNNMPGQVSIICITNTRLLIKINDIQLVMYRLGTEFQEQQLTHIYGLLLIRK